MARGRAFVLPCTFHPGEFLKDPTSSRLYDDDRYIQRNGYLLTLKIGS